MKFPTLWLAAALVMFSTTAQSQITVSRSVIEFGKDSVIQDIEVMNTGDFKIYLDMTIAEIIDPESESPTRVQLDDPRTAPVLVSPKQLLVPPGERKRMRVILREPAVERDRVFRLAVKPYTGALKIDDTVGDKKASAIKVLVGYDLLLLSRPANANPDIMVTRHDDRIEFVNKGNTNVLLRKIEQCDVAESDCEEMQPNRLYAGEFYSIKLPKVGSAEEFPIKVWKAVGLKNSIGTY
jgi:P pilus assembly chaperone PapD